MEPQDCGIWNGGVQIGGPISGDVVAGAVRGVGRTAEIVVLHRDGSFGLVADRRYTSLTHSKD